MSCCACGIACVIDSLNCMIDKVVSGSCARDLPVIKNNVEKYKPLLTEAKRARLLEQSSNMREVMVRRQLQHKDTKLVRRNAFLLRRGISASGVFCN